MEDQEREESCHISRHTVKQGLQSPVGNQTVVKKLPIGTRNDLHDND